MYFVRYIAVVIHTGTSGNEPAWILRVKKRSITKLYDIMKQRNVIYPSSTRVRLLYYDI